MIPPEILRISPNLYAIDIKPLGIANFISSYVVKDHEVAIIDCGPPCSTGNLIEGLRSLGIKPSSVRYVLGTHIHIDHSGGASQLLEWAPEAELCLLYTSPSPRDRG